MDDHALQRDTINERLTREGHSQISDDELKLFTSLLKDSLLSELDNLKGEDLSYESKAEQRTVGERTLSGAETRECVICGSKIKDFGHYSIEFGSQIRKRANLCGLDCMSEFIDALRDTKGL
jgi:hypothetical protein